MKRFICIIAVMLMCVSMFGCGSSSGQKSRNEQSAAILSGDVDVDLTVLSSTMVYSEVYNMMSYPENYLGKSVRMRGTFTYEEANDRYYLACIITDATACCSQGLEFVLKDERKFPDDYPAKGTEITVVGIFDTYTEGTRLYAQLIDAVME